MLQAFVCPVELVYRVVVIVISNYGSSICIPHKGILRGLLIESSDWCSIDQANAIFCGVLTQTGLEFFPVDL